LTQHACTRHGPLRHTDKAYDGCRADVLAQIWPLFTRSRVAIGDVASEVHLGVREASTPTRPTGGQAHSWSRGPIPGPQRTPTFPTSRAARQSVHEVLSVSKRWLEQVHGVRGLQASPPATSRAAVGGCPGRGRRIALSHVPPSDAAERQLRRLRLTPLLRRRTNARAARAERGIP